MIYFSYRNNGLGVHYTRDEVFDAASAKVHAHTRCELYYFIGGEGYYTVEGNHYTLSPGTVLLMRGGEAHMPHILPDAPYERIAIHFPIEYLDGEDPALVALFSERPLGQNNAFPPTEDADYLHASLLRLCATDTPPTDRRIRAYLIPVLYELAHRRKLSATTPLPPARPHDPLIMEILEYINAHLTEEFDLDELSRRFFFSKSHINKVFRVETGSSLWDYVVVKRLIYARALLGRGVTAAAAAQQSGFSDYSSFFRLYRRRFGVSPSQDRGEFALRRDGSSDRL